jgi:hypothetical protein
MHRRQRFVFNWEWCGPPTECPRTQTSYSASPKLLRYGRSNRFSVSKMGEAVNDCVIEPAQLF